MLLARALGHDRMLNTNTAKRHVHSLFRQGCMLYDLIPTMPETRLRPLAQRTTQMLQDQPLFADVFRVGLTNEKSRELHEVATPARQPSPGARRRDA